jgi:hypothetical protein
MKSQWVSYAFRGIFYFCSIKKGGIFMSYTIVDHFAENIVAVLSTTVLPKDGIYQIITIDDADKEKVFAKLKGVPHYIGHPATKEIIERLGAEEAPTKLFVGLEKGETAVAFSIKQGRSNRAKDGFSNPHQEVTLDDLEVRLIRHISLQDYNEGWVWI